MDAFNQCSTPMPSACMKVEHPCSQLILDVYSSDGHRVMWDHQNRHTTGDHPVSPGSTLSA